MRIDHRVLKQKYLQIFLAFLQIKSIFTNNISIKKISIAKTLE